MSDPAINTSTSGGEPDDEDDVLALLAQAFDRIEQLEARLDAIHGATARPDVSSFRRRPGEIPRRSG